MPRPDATVPLRERMGTTLAVAYVSTGLGQLASQLFFFLLLGYLSVESVGLYSFAVAVATIYAYVTDFGLATFLVGELPRAHYRLRSVIELIVLTRTPVLLVGFAGLQLWARLVDPTSEEYWAVAVMGLTFVIQLCDVGLTPWFQTHQRQNAVNLVALIVPLVRLAGIGLPVVLGIGLSLRTVIGVFLGAQLLGTACLLVLGLVKAARTSTDEPDAGVRQLLARFLARGPRLALMYAVNVIQTRADWLLVSALISRVALANYSLANKVIESVMLVAGVWARTSFPWHSRGDAESPHLAARLSLLRRLFVVSSGLAGVVLFFWSSRLLHLLFGDKYADADAALGLMTLVTAIFMLNQYLLYAVLSRQMETKYTWLIVAATVIQLVVDLTLIPRLGILGAAVGMVAMAVLLHAGQMALLVRGGALPVDEAVRVEIFLACSVGGLAMAWLLGVGAIVGTAIATLIVAGVGGGVVLREPDRDQIWRWIMKLRPSSPAA